MTAKPFRVIISADYPEGAVLAMARAAARQDQLARLYTTFYSPRWARFASAIPSRPLRRWMERRLNRRYFDGISPDAVRTAGEWSQIVHMLALRLPWPRDLGTRSMYNVKAVMDRRVSTRIHEVEFDAVVGVYAAAMATLRRARGLGRLAVLHFVNSHPVYHNRYLSEMAGLRVGHPELMPDEVRSRVEGELEAADLVLVPSEFIARQLRERGVPDARIAVEPYGVDLGLFHPRDERSATPGDHRLRCLFVGQISHRKGVRVLLDAAERLRGRPVDFVLLGPMVSPEVLDNLPLNVRWTPASTLGGVAAEMRSADIFVLPSLEDAYPLAAIEAMASGLPVVTSDHAGTSELITHGQDGLIVPAGDAVALAQALERLIDQPELRAALGTAGRNRVQDGHSWDDYGTRVLARIAQRARTTHRPAAGPSGG